MILMFGNSLSLSSVRLTRILVYSLLGFQCSIYLFIRTTATKTGGTSMFILVDLFKILFQYFSLRHFYFTSHITLY